MAECFLLDRDEVIATLRAHEPELKAAGILHLRLHGSVARGAATPTSDVDLIADIDTSKRPSLLDMVGRENRLSDLLGVPVDLSPAHVLKDPVGERGARPCLPFREPSLWLRDIAEAIERIEQFTQGMDFESYRADRKTIAAVERKLLLISEAAIRLGDRGPALCPGLPWDNIRGLGNWLRHQYDRVDVETV